MSHPIEPTLGADPEFLAFTKGGVIVSAAQTSFGDQQSEIGGDVSGRPFEVRPRPSTDPLQVVSNIRAALQSHALRNPGFYHDFTWRAGSFALTPKLGRNTPIGGHIHVGGLKKVLPSARAALILDNYVGLISVLIEDRKEGLKRRHSNAGDYGHASDVREQPYGFEYRTPSSWITSPYVAAGMLCLTKAVLHDVVNTPGFVPLDYDLRDEIARMQTKTLRKHYLDTVHPSIKGLTMCEQYRPYLALLHTLIVKGHTWYPTCSMKEAWGIAAPPKVPLTKRPTLASIWRRAAVGEVAPAPAPTP